MSAISLIMRQIRSVSPAACCGRGASWLAAPAELTGAVRPFIIRPSRCALIIARRGLKLAPRPPQVSPTESSSNGCLGRRTVQNYKQPRRAATVTPPIGPICKSRAREQTRRPTGRSGAMRPSAPAEATPVHLARFHLSCQPFIHSTGAIRRSHSRAHSFAAPLAHSCSTGDRHSDWPLPVCRPTGGRLSFA